MKAIRLHGQVATVEAAKAAPVSELNSLKERTTALEGQVAAFESATVIKDIKLASSNAQITKLTQDLSNFQLSCDELCVKAASLEFEKDKLVDKVSTLETTCSGIHDQVSGYDPFKEQIEVVQDEQLDGDGFLAAHEDGLAAGIEHGKAGRGLIDVAAYDPSTKANSVSTVNALHTMDFPLLS
ncbi:hypothetical protein Tco_0386739 [Tanacetum coccineum]